MNDEFGFHSVHRTAGVFFWFCLTFIVLAAESYIIFFPVLCFVVVCLFVSELFKLKE